LVSAVKPFWPFLLGGTLLILLVTVGLLMSLRDKRAEPDGPVPAGGDQVPSPRGPIRVEWIEPAE
jgi:hypothetical protein